MAYLLLYVDNMIPSASSTSLLHRVIGRLKSEFAVKEMGPVSYFLGIEVQCTSSVFFSPSPSMHMKFYNVLAC